MDNLYKTLKEKKFIISGPCVIENESMIMYLAENVKKLTEDLDFTHIFKASSEKANRTSLNRYRGLAPEEGLRILEKVKKDFKTILESIRN